MKQYRWLAYPYAVWMIIFIVVPLMLVLFFSVTAKAPDGSIVLTLENFTKFWEPMYINVLIRSVLLAVYSTVICLVLGYPLALILAGRDFKRKNILVMLAVIPMWMNFLLRTYSWMTLLEKNGTINAFFGTLERLAATYLNMELTLPRVNILYTETAVILGMVYNFLPFMILPIYSVVSKLDRSLIEAAQDLGGNNLVVFKRVIFPLSLPGVLSGITMVFMPAVTTFVISRLLGGAQFMLIGNLIERQFLFSNDWGFGSALSIIMLLLILLSMGFMSRYEKENSGGGLW